LQVSNPTAGVEILSNAFLAERLFSGETVNRQISAASMLVFWTIAPPLVGLWKFDTDDL
jgi:ABC-2 type transport system permease protein